MYKTELINKVYEAFNEYQNRTREQQISKCSAWISQININGERYTVLRSYRTLVALYSHINDVVYAFDYYSATTSKHIGKFTKMMNAKHKINLYADSRTSKKTRLLNEWQDYNSLIRED